MIWLMLGCVGSSEKTIDSAVQTDNLIADFADFWGSADVVYTPRISRLQHIQWQNATSSLLSFDAQSHAEMFVNQPLLDPFSLARDETWVSPVLFHHYQLAAERIARGIRLDSGWYQRVFPADSRTEGVSFSPIWDSDELFLEAEQALSDAQRMVLSVDIPSAAPYLFTVEIQAAESCEEQVSFLQLIVAGEVRDEVLIVGEEIHLTSWLEAGEIELEIAYQQGCLEATHFVSQISLSGWPDLGISVATEEEQQLWVRGLVQTAFRRAITEEEYDFWFAVYVQGASEIGSGDDIADGVEWLVSAILQSPHFLYRIEYSPDGEALSYAELITKLSFQMCNQPPSSELMAAINNADFVQQYPEFLHQFLRQDCTQKGLQRRNDKWMFLDGYANIFSADEVWDSELNSYFQEEFRAFMQQLIFVEEGGVYDLYTADFTMANAEIAALYGKEGGESFEKIDLPADQRAGLLTLTGFLARDSDGEKPSPIYRGMVINWVFLCADLPNAPDDVSPLPDIEAGMSHRELIEAYTGEGTCGESCHHTVLNPPGFALESYDQLGRWRTEDNGLPIDASGSFTFVDQGEVSWNTSVEFAQHLAVSREAHQCYVQNLFAFAQGREAQEEDQQTIEKLVERSQQGRSILGLLHDILMSNGFRYRGVE